jgi:hypothetical protein
MELLYLEDLQVLKDFQELSEQLESQVLQETLDMQARFKDLQDPPVLQDLLEFLEALQIQDPLDLLEHSQEQQVLQVLQEVQQIQDLLDSLD